MTNRRSINTNDNNITISLTVRRRECGYTYGGGFSVVFARNTDGQFTATHAGFCNGDADDGEDAVRHYGDADEGYVGHGDADAVARRAHYGFAERRAFKN